jgi:hypothetical protein
MWRSMVMTLSMTLFLLLLELVRKDIVTQNRL